MESKKSDPQAEFLCIAIAVFPENVFFDEKQIQKVIQNLKKTE